MKFITTFLVCAFAVSALQAQEPHSVLDQNAVPQPIVAVPAVVVPVAPVTPVVVPAPVIVQPVRYYYWSSGYYYQKTTVTPYRTTFRQRWRR